MGWWRSSTKKERILLNNGLGIIVIQYSDALQWMVIRNYSGRSNMPIHHRVRRYSSLPHPSCSQYQQEYTHQTQHNNTNPLLLFFSAIGITVLVVIWFYGPYHTILQPKIAFKHHQTLPKRPAMLSPPTRLRSLAA